MEVKEVAESPPVIIDPPAIAEAGVEAHRIFMALHDDEDGIALHPFHMIVPKLTATRRGRRAIQAPALLLQIHF